MYGRENNHSNALPKSGALVSETPMDSQAQKGTGRIPPPQDVLP